MLQQDTVELLRGRVDPAEKEDDFNFRAEKQSFLIDGIFIP